MLTRRQFILASAALATSGLVTANINVVSATKSGLITCATDRHGQYFAVCLNTNGELQSTIPLPARGHGIAVNPHHKQAVIFARRPGRFMIKVDLQTGELLQQIRCQADRHSYGHGCFSGDGNTLFSIENDYAKQRGLVVVRDAQNLQVLAEWDTGAIGPHEVILMPDQKHLAIANGGILTHPDQPRAKLNLSNMQPNLAYMSLSSGNVTQLVKPNDHQLSLRHIAVSKQGQVIIGAQYQGHKYKVQPLIFSHQMGDGPLLPLQAGLPVWQRMKQYTASVSIDSEAQQVAVTCPRGGIVTVWDLQSLNLLNTQQIVDCAGVSSVAGDFVFSNGAGDITRLTQQVSEHALFKFDNHMMAV